MRIQKKNSKYANWREDEQIEKLVLRGNIINETLESLRLFEKIKNQVWACMLEYYRRRLESRE